jgi:hypothetical protein
MGAQLTVFDALGERERLDDGRESGIHLLQPLLARGWVLHRMRPFAGAARWLFVLGNGTFEVKREGEALGDVAIEMFEEAARLTSASAAA